MVSAAGERPLMEMGSRRTHERAAVAAARAAYIAGFAASSNLEAQRRYGIPTEGTAAHAFTMLHTHTGRTPETGELAAFRAQVDALGTGTTLLVDTYDVTTGVANAVAAAGATLGAVRIDSGELGVLARQVRDQLDQLGATQTRIVVSGDLDEFSIAALRADPVDSYGVGTSLVTGSGAPTAGMVYKLVEVDGMPVQKRSSHKESRGGHKEALRLSRPTGTITEEVVYPAGRPPDTTEPCRVLTTPLVRGGQVVPAGQRALAAARELVASGLRSLPWEGLKLAPGEPGDSHDSRSRPDSTRSTTCPGQRLRVRGRAAGHRGGRARRQRTQRPAGDGRRGRAGLRDRRAPGRAGRHRHRQVAGVSGSRDCPRRQRRRARSWCRRRRSPCSANSSIVICPGWPIRSPMRCPAGRSSPCSKGDETTCA